MKNDLENAVITTTKPGVALVVDTDISDIEQLTRTIFSVDYGPEIPGSTESIMGSLCSGYTAKARSNAHLYICCLIVALLFLVDLRNPARYY